MNTGKEGAMPTREDRRLKLVASGGRRTGTARTPARRRTVIRLAPPADDAIAAILADLDGAPAPRTPKPHPRGRLVLALGGLLLCAALVATGVFGRQWYADRQLADAHQRALAAARQTTVNFVSISASTVDSDLRRIVAGAGGDFKDEFLRGQDQVRAAVVENKVESHGTVLRAALVSGDLRSAVVLVAIDATVRNVNAPDGRPSHYRIQVEMIRDRSSGNWLVSRLQFVG